MDLRKKKKNRIMLNIPTVSSSKNPSEVRPMKDEFKARNKDEKIAAFSPPISLQRKYIAKHVNAPIMAGKITQSSNKVIGRPNALKKTYNEAAVTAKPGRDPLTT